MKKNMKKNKIDKCGTCGRTTDKCDCAKIGKGAKNDKDKPDWTLFPLKTLDSTIRVLMSGAKTYSKDNWKRVPNGRDRYFAALLRHLSSWQDGELIDKDTNESHLAHAMCCLTFLIWIESNKKE